MSATMQLVYTPDDRDRLRSDLLNLAANDARLTGAASTGSAALEREDQWSDIDLAFGVSDGVDVAAVLSDWTAMMYRRADVLHHCDLQRDSWSYRVFLLRSTMQVELAFAPAAEFRVLAPSFRLVFGQASEPQYIAPAASDKVIGLAWLYALHARSSIARRRFWQAEYMISGVRQNALALACLRLRLPATQGRSFDLLPAAVAAAFEDALVGCLDAAELSRAFRAALRCFRWEVRLANCELADRLEGAFALFEDPMSPSLRDP
jgi:hypothetical protein